MTVVRPEPDTAVTAPERNTRLSREHGHGHGQPGPHTGQGIEGVVDEWYVRTEGVDSNRPGVARLRKHRGVSVPVPWR